MGAWVTLVANELWGVDVVALGLMNGARGRVIGVAEVGAAGSQDVAFVISFVSFFSSWSILASIFES